MRKSLLLLLFWAFLKLTAPDAQAAGLTIVTHGFNSTTTGWVTNMAKAIGNFSGTNSGYAIYRLKFVHDAEQNVYYPAITDFAGTMPSNSYSGEIIVMLDWGEISGGVFTGVPFSTAPIAAATMEFLSTPGNFPYLGERTPLELPIHLIGHSRGGSMVSELSRLMGEAGLWVDQVTTLDPHPLNNGFDDSFVTSIVDPDALIFENVRYAENYYQVNNSILGSDPSGKALAGAYNRYLTNLVGKGYTGIPQRHANVHLWYHGTIDYQTPLTDGEAFLEFDERDAWYTDTETAFSGIFSARGYRAGYRYSRFGNLDSPVIPAPGLSTKISDGLHASFSTNNNTANRVGLVNNHGHWPNLTHLIAKTTGGGFPAGSNFSAAFAFQYAQATNQSVEIEFYLDRDKNPFNGLGSFAGTYNLPATTRGNFGAYQVELISDPNVFRYGTNYLCGVIKANDNVRYLYDRTSVFVMVSQFPPEIISIQEVDQAMQLVVQGYTSQRIIVEASIDLNQWIPIGTNNVLNLERTAEFTDTQAPFSTHRFYRAKLHP